MSLIAFVGLVVLLSMLATSVATAETPPVTKGPIPDEAFHDGRVDILAVPDFIPALDRQGQVVGYISKRLALPDDAAADVGRIPVLADDLRTIVGYMVDDVGWVPLDQTVDALPTIRVDASADEGATR